MVDLGKVGQVLMMMMMLMMMMVKNENDYKEFPMIHKPLIITLSNSWTVCVYIYIYIS